MAGSVESDRGRPLWRNRGGEDRDGSTDADPIPASRRFSSSSNYDDDALDMLLRPVLQCPACKPGCAVVHPTTLLCGHTVCTKHVTLRSPSPSDEATRGSQSAPLTPSSKTTSSSGSDPRESAGVAPLPSCPILTCSAPNPGGPRPLRRRHAPRLPSSLHAPIIPQAGDDVEDSDDEPVIYIPPPTSRAGPPPPGAHVKVAHPRIDVTLSRVLGVIARFDSNIPSANDQADSLQHASTSQTQARAPSSGALRETKSRIDRRSSSRSSGGSIQRIRRGVANLHVESLSRPASPLGTMADQHSSSATPDEHRQKRRRRGSASTVDTVESKASTSTAEKPDDAAPSTRSPSPDETQAGTFISPPIPPFRDSNTTVTPLEDEQLAAGKTDDELKQLSELREALLPELSCDVCYQLFFDPVTTPCQHTFCSKCLLRSLDHSALCPLCREELPGFSFYHDHPSNSILLKLIITLFPTQYAARRAAVLSDEGLVPAETPSAGATVPPTSSSSSSPTRMPIIYDNVPIFPCTLAFPYQPIALNIFEPRYRLMLRRVLARSVYGSAATSSSSSSTDPDSLPTHRTGTYGASFGMTMHPNPYSGDEVLYGTMLRIKRVQMHADGRSSVESVGTWRFRILSRGWVDGYMVARVERIDDYSEEVEARLDMHSMSRGPSPSPAVNTNAPAPRTGASGAVTPAPSQLLPPPPLPTPRSQLYDPSRPFGPAEIEHASTEELVARCLAFIEKMRRRVAPWVAQRMDQAYGEMPEEDSARLSYWMALVLPIDDYDKGKLLPLRSPRLRLRLIAHWINALDKQGWWQSSGCVVM